MDVLFGNLKAKLDGSLVIKAYARMSREEIALISRPSLTTPTCPGFRRVEYRRRLFEH